jgi:hypothetical protein
LGRILILLLFVAGSSFSQTFNEFLKPSDSLNVQRRNLVLVSEAALATGTLVGLSELWYKDYPKSEFHFINDNSEWLQMDKAGHVFSSYHMGRFGAELLNWSGSDKKSQLIYGSTLGFAFLTVVEVFDGYSAKWGASWGDVAANASGTALYVSQELLWKEQRIIPKFSFHTTHYPNYRPDLLGSSLNERILKDYNGQTYWLSGNIRSFFKDPKIPKWLNVAVGYGADGMITGNTNSDEIENLPKFVRARQFYLSLDVDLTKIRTQSAALKTLFSVFNTIKIPAPTFEINGSGKAKWHAFYF